MLLGKYAKKLIEHRPRLNRNTAIPLSDEVGIGRTDIVEEPSHKLSQKYYTTKRFPFDSGT
jgi:hypothetical protein